jgi:ubiquinone biosynthesis protein
LYRSKCSKDPSHDGKRIARQGLAAAVKQILANGFFHADPHPGNLLVTENMNLCIIDWGMVGRLTEKERLELTEFLRAVVEKDSRALVQSLLRMRRPSDRDLDSASKDQLIIY